jgi:CysZ protein
MIQDFFRGLEAYKHTLGFISRHRLWTYVIVPGLICAVLISLLFFGTLQWLNVDTLPERIAALFPDWLSWLETAVVWLLDAGALYLVLALVFAVIFFFIGKYIILIIAAPFMGPLSEKVEAIVRGHKIEITSNFFQDLMRGIRISLRNIVRELGLTILFLFFNLIPVVGSIIGTVLTLLVEAYYAGFGNFDYTLERKHYDVSQSVAFVRQNRGLAIGNGAIFLVLMMIPFLGWFLAPAYATIAGTIAVLERVDGLKFEG